MTQFISRRTALRRSGLIVSAPAIAQILRCRSLASESRRSPSVIFITMGGGASQFETFDPKPDAPAEYRGEFRAISTRIPGVQFCELLPKLAVMADRLAIVRSIHHEQASHIAEHIVETGYDITNFARTLTCDMPSIGSAVSRLLGIGPSGIPSYVSIPRHHGYSGPHWIGPQHHFFPVDGDPNSPDFAVNNLALTDAVSVSRLEERRRLQTAFSQKREVADPSGAASTIDTFTQQAFDLVTGEKAQRAFRISAEDPRLRDRYGRNTFGQRLMLARRLVEAEVPFIKVRMFDWDDHDNIARKIQPRNEMFDAGVSALIDDLAQRGLSRDVLVIAMGEFGRTPRVNLQAGRDHYPAVNSILYSGGRYQMGQVIGATDRIASQVTEAPYRPQNAIAMVYRHLEIDPGTTFNDFSGRPRHLLEERRPIAELL